MSDLFALLAAVYNLSIGHYGSVNALLKVGRTFLFPRMRALLAQWMMNKIVFGLLVRGRDCRFRYDTCAPSHFLQYKI